MRCVPRPSRVEDILTRQWRRGRSRAAAAAAALTYPKARPRAQSICAYAHMAMWNARPQRRHAPAKGMTGSTGLLSRMESVEHGWPEATAHVVGRKAVEDALEQVYRERLVAFV